jgi:hypothetical protein
MSYISSIFLNVECGEPLNIFRLLSDGLEGKPKRSNQIRRQDGKNAHLKIDLIKGFCKGKVIPTGLDRPRGFQEVEASRFLRQSAHESGKVVRPTHRPSLTPGNIPGTHFC